MRTGPFEPAAPDEPSRNARSRPATSPPGYTIIAERGRGGMGVVYEATDDRLKRTVALKMMLSREIDESLLRFLKDGGPASRGTKNGGVGGVTHMLLDPSRDPALVRFLLEAEAMAQVRHSYVAQVFEAGEHDGRPFIAMEYLSGGSLADKLAGGRQTTRDALGLMAKVSRGVEAAHRQGIIHRDLKPGNVMFDGAGEPKVTDFGLAKRGSQNMTQSEAMLGTPAYMAPEQARGETKMAGAAADVYALGVMLYEITTGARPFEGRTPEAVLYQTVHMAPDAPRRRNPALPRDVELITLKCLEKDPADRYADAGKLADDMERYLAGMPVSVRAAGPLERLRKWAWRNPGVAASLLTAAVALVGGTAVSYAKYREAKAHEAVAVVNEATANKRTTEAIFARQEEAARVVERDAALEDTKYQLGVSEMLLAVAAHENGDTRLCNDHLEKVPAAQRGWEWHYLFRLNDGGDFTIYGHSQEATCVRFSPDGGRIVTGGEDMTAKVWDARTGGHLATLSGHTAGVKAVAFPGSTRIFTASSNDYIIRAWDATSGVMTDEMNRQRPNRPVGPLFKFDSIPEYPLDSTPPASAKLLDGSVQVWGWASFRRLFSVNFNVHNPMKTKFSPDGRRVAVWDGQSNRVRIWDVATDSLCSEIKYQRGGLGVEFSPDGSQFLACDSANVKIWDTRSGLELRTLALQKEGQRYGESLKVARFSPDGSRVAAGTRDGKVIVWDWRSDTRVVTLAGHLGAVNDLAFSPDGDRLATACSDGTIKLWGAHAERRTRPLVGRRGQEADQRTATEGAGPAPKPPGGSASGGTVSFNDDGTRIAACGDGMSVLDEGTGEPIQTINGMRCISGLRSVPGGGKFVSAGNYERIATVWDAAAATPVATLRGHTGEVRCADFNPDGSRVVTGAQDGTARVWDATTGVELLTLNGHVNGGNVYTGAIGRGRSVNGVAFSPDGSLIASGGGDWVVRVWAAADGGIVSVLRGHTNAITRVVFSPDGSLIASTDMGGIVRLWAAVSGKSAGVLRGHKGFVSGAAFSPDGARLISWGQDGTIRVWDVRTGVPLIAINAPGGSVSSVQFSKDGSRVVSSGSSAVAYVWDAFPRPERVVLTGHADLVTAVAFSRDGKHVATGSRDGMAKVWDAKTGRPLASLVGHSNHVSHMAFSPDGSRIVTGGHDKSVRVWDAASGAQITELKGHTNWVGRVAFSADGFRVVTGSHDRSILIWDGQQTLENPNKTIAMSDHVVRVWDPVSGREVKEGLPRMEVKENGPGAPEVDWHIDFDKVILISRITTPAASRHQRLRSVPSEWRIREEYDRAKAASDTPAAFFHLERLLALPGTDTTNLLRDRHRLTGDPRHAARANFHTGAALLPCDTATISVLATFGDRLSRRLVAQSFMSAGRHDLAIPLLHACLISRDATDPPVEEILIALSYSTLGDRLNADRYYQAASRWEDRREMPARAANVISSVSVNGWSSLAKSFIPINNNDVAQSHWENMRELKTFKARFDAKHGFKDGVQP